MIDFRFQPLTAGHRVTVRRIQALVEERDLEPRVVADRLEPDVAALYWALAYYRDNPGEMQDLNQRRPERTVQSRENG